MTLSPSSVTHASVEIQQKSEGYTGRGAQMGGVVPRFSTPHKCRCLPYVGVPVVLPVVLFVLPPDTGVRGGVVRNCNGGRCNDE